MEYKYNFTFIIPHYNVPDLLQRCLDSIPKRNDIQVIVVDDNSNPEIVDFSRFPGLERENTEVVLTKEGKGAGYARNIGLKHAIGKWLLFADADDFFVDDLDNILNNHVNDEEDILYFMTKAVLSSDISKESDRNFCIDKHVIEFLKYGREAHVRCWHSVPWGKIIRRSFVEENGILFDEVRYANDYYFAIVAGCKAKRVKAYNVPLYIVTEREGSLASTFCEKEGELEIRTEVCMRGQQIITKYGYRFPEMPVSLYLRKSFEKDPRLFRKNIRKIGDIPFSVKDAWKQTSYPYPYYIRCKIAFQFFLSFLGL